MPFKLKLFLTCISKPPNDIHYLHFSQNNSYEGYAQITKGFRNCFKKCHSCFIYYHMWQIKRKIIFLTSGFIWSIRFSYHIGLCIVYLLQKIWKTLYMNYDEMLSLFFYLSYLLYFDEYWLTPSGGSPFILWLHHHTTTPTGKVWSESTAWTGGVELVERSQHLQCSHKMSNLNLGLVLRN